MMDLMRIASLGSMTFAAVLALNSQAAKADNITLSSGETRYIDHPAVVTCEIQSVTVISNDCNCVDPGRPYLKELNRTLILSNGYVRETMIGRYDDMDTCWEALAAAPVCDSTR